MNLQYSYQLLGSQILLRNVQLSMFFTGGRTAIFPNIEPSKKQDDNRCCHGATAGSKSSACKATPAVTGGLVRNRNMFFLVVSILSFAVLVAQCPHSYFWLVVSKLKNCRMMSNLYTVIIIPKKGWNSFWSDALKKKKNTKQAIVCSIPWICPWIIWFDQGAGHGTHLPLTQPRQNAGTLV